ncbi:signal transduction protein [Moorella sp. E308F]|uniref:globin-coupled sensor protein n=1 Tax=Moorella sp. E308F TaxID=2572682 RepID=UPI0010FFABBA|nr:globin-coupled sensor protein [Moorella sp. E308F]GEA16448.1 signal transduction protein [Moorella sp. E308F]
MAIAATYAEQLRFLGIGEAELALMHAERDIFMKEADTVVKNFYDQLVQYPYLDALIKNHSTIERLSKTQKAYFISLTSPVIDQEYISWRLRIGKKHQEIGLYPKWYLGSYRLYFSELHRIIWHYHGDDPDLALRLLEAFTKRIVFDMQLAIESYIIDQLQHLTRFHDEIAAVARIIGDIAEQTKILSLNASIEAARAGEHGRTFTVVAQAVRDLAARTSQSAKDITQKVQENHRILARMQQKEK